jgi:hypothetical protein
LIGGYLLNSGIIGDSDPDSFDQLTSQIKHAELSEKELK